MNNMQRVDRAELLSVTRNLSLERKAELIFLHCVHGETINGNDSWYIDEVAELYGIRPANGVYRNCYPGMYSYREIYNLMYTYPEGFEDRELRFEDIVLDINLNRALRYYANGAGRDMQPPLDPKYDRYENYEGKDDGEPITVVENVFGEGALKPVKEEKTAFSNMNTIILCICIVGMIFILWQVMWDQNYQFKFLPKSFYSAYQLISEVGKWVGLIATSVVLIMMIFKRTRRRSMLVISILSIILTAILLIQLKFIPFVVGVIFTVLIFVKRKLTDD